MLRLFRSPGAGLIVAVIALFVALGSGVYAASKINGKQIKKSSIAGNKLKPDGVTGKQINESSLGKVPSAQSAETAQSADNAATLGGEAPGSFLAADNVQHLRSDFSVGANQSDSRSHQIGPLTLTTFCNDNLNLQSLRATTSAQGAGLDATWSIQGAGTTVTGNVLNTTPFDFLSIGAPPDFRRAVGTILYNDPQRTISIPFVLVFDTTGAGARCFFTGTATNADATPVVAAK